MIQNTNLMVHFLINKLSEDLFRCDDTIFVALYDVIFDDFR